jgi:hypothetical protein
LHDLVAAHERLLSIIEGGDIEAIARELAVHIHSPSPADIEADGGNPVIR